MFIYSEGHIPILPALQKFEETQVQGINAETLNLSLTLYRINFLSMFKFWGICLPWNSDSLSLIRSCCCSLFIVQKVKLIQLIRKHHFLVYVTIDVLYIWREVLIWPLLIRYILHNGLFAVSKSCLHDVLGNQLYSAIPMVKKKIHFNWNSAEGLNLRKC